MSLLQRSLSAGAAIALTALLRAACRGRLPRRMFVALWDLAALRLLVPLSLPWAYAPRALLRALLSHGPQQTAKVRQIAYTAAAVTAQTTVMDMPAQGAAALPWGSILWLTVMLLLAAYFARVSRQPSRVSGSAAGQRAADRRDPLQRSAAQACPRAGERPHWRAALLRRPAPRDPAPPGHGPFGRYA